MADFVRWNERKVDPAYGDGHQFPRQAARDTIRGRLYSQTGADWQYRVDFDRLRRERLQKLQAEMKVDDLGALVLFAGANIRYATASTRATGNTTSTSATPCVPAEGRADAVRDRGLRPAVRQDRPAVDGTGRIRPAITWQWAEGAVPFMAGRMADSVMEVLKEHKVEKEKIGIDNLDMPAFEALQQARPEHRQRLAGDVAARVVKTRDEIELLKQASSIGDAAMWKIEYEWLKPGVREREIEAKVHEFMLERGCDFIYDIIVASGGNTSPYRRWATDKLIRQGDLVIVDINAVGPSGYFIDFVRCFKCGGAQGTKMTPEGNRPLPRGVRLDVRRHRRSCKPGNTTADVAKQFPHYDDDEYGTVTLQQFAHSIGITLYEGMWMSRAYSLKYPAEIKENMYFAIETFAGHPGLEQTAASRRTCSSPRRARSSSRAWSTWKRR